MVKTAAVIHYWGKKYKKLGACAVNSFKKFNPDVDVFKVGNKNEHKFKCLKKTSLIGAAKRLGVALELMKERGYEKVIILGADTITCSRLDEFLDINRVDILATFDYCYPFFGKRFTTKPTQRHLNADVICFNDAGAIEKLIDLCQFYTEEDYGEQGALNELFYDPANGVTGAWVEERPGEPFFWGEAGYWVSQKVCYNVGSKSTMYLDSYDKYGNRYYETTVALTQSSHKPWKPFVERFKVHDGKLFTGDGRQIKVWHYCDGFGSMDDGSFVEIINKWIFEWFNEDTRKFFKEHCECGTFFEKEFSLK